MITQPCVKTRGKLRGDAKRHLRLVTGIDRDADEPNAEVLVPSEVARGDHHGTLGPRQEPLADAAGERSAEHPSMGGPDHDQVRLLGGGHVRQPRGR